MKITVPSDVLVRALRAVMLSASTDGTRAHLNAVWIRALAGKPPHVWATNGHWIGCCRLDGADVVEPGLVGTAVYDVKKLLVVAPQTPMGLTITNDGKHTAFDFSGHTGITVKAIDATPPPVHTIVPDRLSTKKHQRTALSIDVLGPALTAVRMLTKGRKRTAGVRIYAMGPTNLDLQILWSAQCPAYFALLMPFRESTKRDMKWWHDASKDIEAGIAVAKSAAKEVTDAAAE